MKHPNTLQLRGYSAGDPGMDEAAVWAVEAHLELCSTCRAQLAQVIEPDVEQIMQRAFAGIDAGIATGPAPKPVRVGRRVVAAARLWPWLASAVAIILLALGLDQISGTMPSFVLLLAPVVPLLPVAALWSRRLDPLWELTASMPRGGLWMLLRRTLLTLLTLIPVLAVVGWLSGHTSVVWLLPCLALTSGSLLLGEVLGGVDRAAAALSLLWCFAVIVPSLSEERLSSALTGESQLWWSLLTAVLLAVLGFRLRGRSVPSNH